MTQMLVVKLAFRHCEMVHLVMRSARQQADEAETANVLDLLRVGRGDSEQFAIWQLADFRGPALMTIHRLSPGRDHPLDGDQRPPAAGDCNFQTAVDFFRSSIRLE